MILRLIWTGGNLTASRRFWIQYGIKPLIGVVPDNKDANLCKDAPKADFWERIIQIQQQGWIIAMHGYHHVYTTAAGGCFPLNRQSEFAGLSLAKPKEQDAAGSKSNSGST